MAVLQFFKTHLVSLLCGVFALGFIAVGVLGVTSGKVVRAMKEELNRTRATQMASLRRNPQNEQTIAAEQQRAKRFEEEYERTVAAARQINRREVLMPGVFPVPEKAATPYEFRELYARHLLKVLPSRLKAGTAPTEAEIREAQQDVAELIALEAEQRAEEEAEEAGGRRPPAVARAPGPGRVPPLGGGRTRTPGLVPGGRTAPEMAPRMGGPPAGRVGPGLGMGSVAPTRSGDPKYDPVYRARVSKAKSVLCYYDENTFHVWPFVHETAAPSAADMWFAQVALWVQEDVVRAIAELNQEAADAVTGGNACVEHVPVKRLVAVRVLGYDTGKPESHLNFPVDTLPPTVYGPSFTGRHSNEQYDVVRFVVVAVVDQRDVLQLIDRISRANFYQCIGSSYEAVDLNAEMSLGYLYGTDPVIRATLVFEGYFARDVYEEKMPPAVRELLGITAGGQP